MTRDYTEYARRFESCDIDVQDFSHADHVGVAHDLLGRYGFLEAAAIYSACLKTVATRAGAAEKFNVTITLAFLSLIAERMKETEALSFEAFAQANPDLLSGRLLSDWYSAERLTSEHARSVFLLPDKVA